MLIGILTICKMLLKYKFTKANSLILFLSLFSLSIFGKCVTLHTSFTTSETVICGPGLKNISITNLSTGNEAASASYSWYMNGALFDNTTGLSAPRTTTISDLGTYTFMLIGVDGNGCRDTAIMNVFIHPIPVANFTVNGTVCSGTSLSFKNLSSGTGSFTNYSWDFGDGKKSLEQHPTHVYASINSYVISLTVSNGAGCSNTFTDTVVLSQAPIAAIEGKDKDGDTNYCLSADDSNKTDTVHFNNLSQYAQSYRWDFGDGSPLFTTSTKDPVTHVYTHYGIFKVTMIAISSQNCEKSTTLTVVFNKAVDPQLSLQLSEISGCVPHGVMPANTSLYADEYVWDFGDGTPSVTTINAAPFVHIYKKAGVYIITLKASNGCNSETIHSDSIRVSSAPVSKFQLNTVSGCTPQIIEFTNLTAPYSANSYQWNFGDGTVWNGNGNPGNKTYEQGKWKIQLITTNNCGSDSSFIQLIVNKTPAAPNVKEQTICNGTSAKLKVEQPVGICEWFDAATNGNLLATGPDFTTPVLSTTTNYFVQSRSPHCVSERVPVKVVVLPLPDPPVVSGVTICKGNTATLKIALPGKYEWYDLPTHGTCLDSADSFTTPPLFVNTEYYVQLSAGTCKSRRATVKVLVNDPPKANYKSNAVCLGESTAFQDLSTGNPDKWLWDFGDGTTNKEGPSSTHTYATPGVFIVKLTVSNGIGCYDSVLQVTTVHEPVLAKITAKDSACIFENLILQDGSVSGTDSILASSWDFGDGSANMQALVANHVYSNAGNFTVEHSIVSGKGCHSKASKTLHIAPLPVADFTSSNTCQIQNSIFTEQSTKDVIAWNWNFGDKSNSNDAHPQHAYQEGGYYRVWLQVKTSLGCMDSTSKRIFVYRHPVAAFTADTVCWGDTTTFLNLSESVDGSIDFVSWNFGDGAVSNAFAPKHVLQTQQDEFLATLTIVTNHGCKDTLSQWVKTHPLPSFNFFATEKKGCAAFTTAFVDSSSVAGGKITNWLWDFGDGNLTHRRYPIHTFVEAGTYHVNLKVTSTYGCQSVRTLPYPIVVLPKPKAAFEASPYEVSIDQPTVQFINRSTNSVMWDWNFGDHKTSVNKDNLHTYADTGTFVVTLIAISEYGCDDTTHHYIRVNAQPQIYIPNAFSPDGDELNDIFLPVGNGISVFHMSIFDRWGKEIFRTDDWTNGWDGTVNGSGEKVLEGIYIYKIYIKDVLQITHNYAGNVFVTRK